MGIFTMRDMLEHQVDLIVAFEINPSVNGRGIAEVIGGATQSIEVGDSLNFDSVKRERVTLS